MSQCDCDGLADPEFVWLLGPGFDQKDQLGAFLLTIDNWWRVFSAPRDKAYFCCQTFFAPVATHVDDIPVFDGGEYRLRREKTKLEIPWRQYRDNRPTCGHGFARTLVDLLDRTITGTVGVATHEPRL